MQKGDFFTVSEFTERDPTALAPDPPADGITRNAECKFPDWKDRKYYIELMIIVIPISIFTVIFSFICYLFWFWSWEVLKFKL
jgi:hypothetical protein